MIADAVRRFGFFIAAVALVLAVPIVIAWMRTSGGGATVDTDDMSIEALLAALTIMPESEPARYDRESFDYPGGGVDGKGCDTRDRVLIRDSVEPPQVDPFGCKVLAGRWLDPYTGETLTDPAAVSIDHVVALSEAWDSGAASWPPSRRVAFANDVDHDDAMVVISGPGNARKGDKDPTAWTPADPGRRTEYVARWVRVKVRWGLSADQAEIEAIRAVLTPAMVR